MPRGYGQYCPLALAAEVLCERWNILVIGKLMDGYTRFNEINRSLPAMSATLLSQRLKQLQEYGIVKHRKGKSGVGPLYVLTKAGEDIGPIVDHMATWGQNWARDMTLEDLDPGFLVWSMHMRLNEEAMPSGRLVVEFQFTGGPKDCSNFWLVKKDQGAEMCLKNPGLEINLYVQADLRVFIESWRGIRNMRKEIAKGAITLMGPPHLQKQFPNWLLLSQSSPYPRLRPGREKKLQKTC